MNTQNNLETLKFLYQNSEGIRKNIIFKKLESSDDLETLKFLYQNSEGIKKNIIFKKLESSDDLEVLKFLYQNSEGIKKNIIFKKLESLDDSEILNINNSSIDVNEGTKLNQNYQYHFFICHATEDKISIAKPLAIELEKRNFKVWYDDFTLTLGDGLRRSIDKGLSTSQYGIVILSNSFFQKEWPQKELDALVTREDETKKVILPIWHNIGKEDIMQYSPLLSDKLAVSSSKGITFVVDEIIKAYLN